MQGKTVLISGLGIAGPTLAYWLLRYGFEPTIVERAERPRNSGYIVDFWGVGYDIVERMGLLPEVLRAGYDVREVRIVNEHGRRVGGFDARVFREVTNGRFTSLPRGALSAVIQSSLSERVETLFGDRIVALEEGAERVRAEFEHGPSRHFDLVVGADGLHSAVRALTFGSESQVERFLGYTVAAFQVAGYRPREEDVYVTYGAPGCQVARFAMRDDVTMFLIVIADESTPRRPTSSAADHRAYLEEHLGKMGWECPEVLAGMRRTDELYFDDVSQIRLDRWWKGRTCLIGDAAFAPSLLAGQGSALAILSAYVLAGELALSQHPEQAFMRYQTLLESFIEQKQNAAARLAGSFAPRTRLGLFLRNQVTKAFSLPGLAKLAFGASVLDRIELPEFAPASLPPGQEARPDYH